MLFMISQGAFAQNALIDPQLNAWKRSEEITHFNRAVIIIKQSVERTI